MHLYMRRKYTILFKIWLYSLIQYVLSVMYASNYTSLINVEHVTLNNCSVYIFTVIMKHASKTEYK